MPRGEGNGQGNFTTGRNTRSMKKIMDLDIKSCRRKKRYLLVQKFLSFREGMKLKLSKN
ncbi:MAG: hypothetical protein WC933_01630 [Candidatus Paceibacterota bacterium]